MSYRTNEDGQVVEVNERVLSEEEVNGVVAQLDEAVTNGETKKSELEAQLAEVNTKLEEDKASRAQFPEVSGTNEETDGADPETVSESVEDQPEEVQF